MPQLVNASPVAVRVRAHRIRNTMRRQLDVIHRCESLSEEDLDDETFPELIDEIVSDLGVGKEAVADALQVNLATLYRWLKRKNLPLALARRKLLAKLTRFLRADIDAAELRLLEERRGGPGADRFDNHGGAVRFLPPVPQGVLGIADAAVLYPLDSPFGDATHGRRRPTFAAFAWRGVGTFELIPDAAVAQAYVLVTAPGMEYLCNRTRRFVPIDVSEGVGQLIAFIARDAGAPALPPIVMRSRDGTPAFGTLLLTSAHGVPYDVVHQARGTRACIHPLAAVPPDGGAPAEVITIAIPRGAGSMAGLGNLVDFATTQSAANLSHYDHARALALNNFEVYLDGRHHSVQQAMRPTGHESNAAKSLRNHSEVSARVVLFSERTEHFSRYATHVCTHQGAEMIVPLFGSIDAHLIDTESDEFDSHRWGERKGFQLGELIGDGELYEPSILLGPNEANAQVPGIVALNPKRMLHGFTGLSRDAALLALTVWQVSERDGWVARSLVDYTPAERWASHSGR